MSGDSGTASIENQPASTMPRVAMPVMQSASWIVSEQRRSSPVHSVEYEPGGFHAQTCGNGFVAARSERPGYLRLNLFAQFPGLAGRVQSAFLGLGSRVVVLFTCVSLCRAQTSRLGCRNSIGFETGYQS